MSEYGALQESQFTDPAGLVLLDDLRSRDVGRHQVGRELDPAELQGERIGQRVDHQRLGQSGHADQQAMSLREQGDQHFLDHLLLANDHFGQFTGNRRKSLVQLIHGLYVFVF